MPIKRTKNKKQRQQIGKKIEEERTKQNKSVSLICREANVKREQYYNIREGEGYSIDSLLSIIKTLSLEINLNIK